MTRETAIHLAQQAIGNKAILELDFIGAAREQQGNRNIWLVTFARRAKPGVVICPERLFVEVDEETQVASVLLDP